MRAAGCGRTRERGWGTVLLAACLLVAAAVSPVGAQEHREERGGGAEGTAPGGKPAATKRGEAIMERYVRALGGRARLDAVTSYVIEGTLQLPEGGGTAAFRRYQGDDRCYLMEIDLPGGASQKRGYDGQVMWEMSRPGGVRLITGERKASRLRSDALNLLADWKERCEGVTCAGTVEVKGRAAWKLILATGPEATETVYIGEESGLMVRRETHVEGPSGTVTAVIDVGDYRPVGALQMPHRQRVRIGHRTLVLVLGKVELDGVLPEGVFRLPEPVKALIRRGKGRKGASREGG